MLETRVGDGSRVESLYTLDLRYSVVATDVFSRLFRMRDAPDSSPAGPSPYAAFSTPELTLLSDECAESAPEIILPGQCAGHFAGFPALPVAVVMQKLSAIARLILLQRFGSAVTCAVQRAEVAASDLAWAGESVVYRMVWRRDDGIDTVFEGSATTTAGVQVGEMVLTLRR